MSFACDTVCGSTDCKGLCEIPEEPAFTSPEWEGEALLSSMLDGNAHDEVVCEWLRGAKVGDVFDEYHGARVTRVR